MRTKFGKDPVFERPEIRWANFYHAGAAWLGTYELLRRHREEMMGNFVYVDPPVAALCLELQVKALAMYEDKTFKPIAYRHETSRILKDYAALVPEFKAIIDDSELLALIKEYQKTVDSRYGSLGGEISYAEQERIINTAYGIKRAVHERTGMP